jgi:hypothetical protein
MKKLFFPILLIFLILLSCKKDENYYSIKTISSFAPNIENDFTVINISANAAMMKDVFYTIELKTNGIKSDRLSLKYTSDENILIEVSTPRVNPTVNFRFTSNSNKQINLEFTKKTEEQNFKLN